MLGVSVRYNNLIILSSLHDTGWDMSTTYGTTINVPTIAERKTLMFERADAFITLPGGLGTMSELMEVIRI